MLNRHKRIAAIKEKAAQLKAKALQLEAQEARGERKLRERKKFIAGAALLAAAEKGDVPWAHVLEMVDRHNLRTNDRALFSLPPKETA